MPQQQDSSYERFRQRAEPWVMVFAYLFFALVWLFSGIFPVIAGAMAINHLAIGVLLLMVVWLLVCIFCIQHSLRKAWRGYLVIRDRQARGQ